MGKRCTKITADLFKQMMALMKCGMKNIVKTTYGLHHLKAFPLEWFHNFILDNLHLFCLGMIRKLLYFWMKGQDLIHNYKKSVNYLHQMSQVMKIDQNVALSQYILIIYREFHYDMINTK